ncbi:MAG: GAF domain-containing protein [Myxococcota bacterium]
MAEVTLELKSLPKDEAYRQLTQHVRAVLEGVDGDEVAGMATISCLVHHAFGHLWTGFYRVVGPSLLRVGPYQGTLGCLEIKFGKGVCGTSAAKRETVIVPDVHAFPGHITCDGRSASEIVLPVFDARGELIAVFDIDSEHRGTFDEVDRRHLEALLGWFAGR